MAFPFEQRLKTRLERDKAQLRAAYLALLAQLGEAGDLSDAEADQLMAAGDAIGRSVAADLRRIERGEDPAQEI